MSEYEYIKIRPNIWQIKDEQGVYCTLIKGEKLAILWDTGWGNKDIRSFVERNVDTPYIVLNSHGHPDHCLGNHFFKEVYASEREVDVIEHFTLEEYGHAPEYEIHTLKDGDSFDLGGLHATVIPMEGHTKGSIGLLLQEEELLLSGDAVNKELWVFNYGALKIKQIPPMIERVYQLPFKTYLFGHSNRESQKRELIAHLKNIEHLQIDEGTKGVTIGFETYQSTYVGEEGKSVLIFAKELAEE